MKLDNTTSAYHLVSSVGFKYRHFPGYLRSHDAHFAIEFADRVECVEVFESLMNLTKSHLLPCGLVVIPTFPRVNLADKKFIFDFVNGVF